MINSEKVEELLNSDNLNDSNKKLISNLLKDYNKIQRRLKIIIKKNDSSSEEIRKQNSKLEQLSDKLSRYLSPQVYEMIFSDTDIQIKSKRKKLTVFFSDIVNFTDTTENLESEELTSMLNDYLTQMTDIALQFGGTIDKYIGDAIVIFFGDPKSHGYKEDAKKCVLMALAMQEKMKEIEKKYVDDGIVNSFRIRIGITTGYVTVGNFGSDKRMDYTIIGGSVNLAARLEGASHPSSILISHETYSLVKDIVNVSKQAPITVKGISKSIQTYQVHGKKNDEIIEIQNIISKLGEKDKLIEKLESIIHLLKKNK